MRRFPRVVALALAMPLLAGGCATRMLSVTSEPAGAKVTMGDATAVTPAMMALSWRDREAIIVFDSGERRVVPIGRFSSWLGQVRAGSARVGSATCHVVAYPFSFVGATGIGASHAAMESGAVVSGEEVALALALFGVGCGGMLLGFAFDAAGDGLAQFSDVPVMHLHVCRAPAAGPAP